MGGMHRRVCSNTFEDIYTNQLSVNRIASMIISDHSPHEYDSPSNCKHFWAFLQPLLNATDNVSGVLE